MTSKQKVIASFLVNHIQKTAITSLKAFTWFETSLTTQRATPSAEWKAAFVGAAVILIASFGRIPVPWASVPMTLLTLGVLAVALRQTPSTLIKSLGLFIGMESVLSPVPILMRPACGYMVGAAAASFIVSIYAPRCNNSVTLFALLQLATVLIYVGGILGLVTLWHVNIDQAVTTGVLPFIAFDTLKALLLTCLSTKKSEL